MSEQLHTYRERARAHQADIDLSVTYMHVKDLAARWSIAPSTVRDIPRLLLPYAEFGKGTKLKRRRYHPDDVLAYEARDRQREETAA